MDEKSEQIKEIYAQFGLAIYFAQVLEHGLVNSLISLDLIPARHHLAKTPTEWEEELDSFSGRHFQRTMGQLMTDLRSVTSVDPNFDVLLRNALSKRNWLAHNFFRERATEFLSVKGREIMLKEIEECRILFEDADTQLEAIVEPVRKKAGVTDELIANELQRLMPVD